MCVLLCWKLTGLDACLAGHTRYATMGGMGAECCQPFVMESTHGQFALAHNGELVNKTPLKRVVRVSCLRDCAQVADWTAIRRVVNIARRFSCTIALLLYYFRCWRADSVSDRRAIANYWCSFCVSQCPVLKSRTILIGLHGVLFVFRIIRTLSNIFLILELNFIYLLT